MELESLRPTLESQLVDTIGSSLELRGHKWIVNPAGAVLHYDEQDFLRDGKVFISNVFIDTNGLVYVGFAMSSFMRNNYAEDEVAGIWFKLDINHPIMSELRIRGMNIPREERQSAQIEVHCTVPAIEKKYNGDNRLWPKIKLALKVLDGYHNDKKLFT